VGGACSAYGERRGAHRVLVGKREGKSNLEDLGIDGRIFLKRIFRMWGGEAWTELIWHRIRRSGRVLQTR